MLQDIFDKVEKGVKSAKDGSVLDFYRTSLVRLGKAHRVEILMRVHLEGLGCIGYQSVIQSGNPEPDGPAEGGD
jgi:hypothetical protein